PRSCSPTCSRLDSARVASVPEVMRVLLTGACGRLGRVLAPMLRAAGHCVVGLDIVPGPQADVVGSIVDRALIERLFAEHGFDAVVHVAALHQPDLARQMRQAFVDANITGTLNLLEAAVAARATRFVFSSTTSLMVSAAIDRGLTDSAAWIDET